jgi:hypothetical protein
MTSRTHWRLMRTSPPNLAFLLPNAANIGGGDRVAFAVASKGGANPPLASWWRLLQNASFGCQ